MLKRDPNTSKCVTHAQQGLIQRINWCMNWATMARNNGLFGGEWRRPSLVVKGIPDRPHETQRHGLSVGNCMLIGSSCG